MPATRRLLHVPPAFLSRHQLTFPQLRLVEVVVIYIAARSILLEAHMMEILPIDERFILVMRNKPCFFENVHETQDHTRTYRNTSV